LCTFLAPPPNEHYMSAMRSAGDYAITCRVRDAAAELSSRGHAVYTYYFAHTPIYSANYHDLPSLGAFHGSEVPFVFGDAFELMSVDERTLSASMGCFWRNFAHTADPNTPPPNGTPCARQPASWPRFRPGWREATMILDVGAMAPAYGLKHRQCKAFADARASPA